MALDDMIARRDALLATPIHTRTRRRRGGRNVRPRHDWDASYAALARSIHEHGVPATQAELVREMVSWFEARDVEHAPDGSTIRKKIAPVWRELSRG